VHVLKPWRSGGLAPSAIVSPVPDGVGLGGGGRREGTAHHAGMLLVRFPMMSVE
jgi:hypothetical protein